MEYPKDLPGSGERLKASPRERGPRRRFKEKTKDPEREKRLQELKGKDEDRTAEEDAEMTGLQAFPNDKRGAELVMKQKLETITDPEKAELQGKHAFPNDQEGAALQTKETLGTITEAETNLLIEKRTAETKQNNPVVFNL